jgi:hypothetical protein
MKIEWVDLGVYLEPSTIRERFVLFTLIWALKNLQGRLTGHIYPPTVPEEFTDDKSVVGTQKLNEFIEHAVKRFKGIDDPYVVVVPPITAHRP